MASTRKKPGRLYAGENPAERKSRRKQQFVEAGLELFGTAGYRQATVRELCRQAELTDRYFYESFASTEDLLVAVYLECIARIRGEVVARVAAGPAAGAESLFERALDGFFTCVEDSRLARVVWLEVLGVSPRVDQVYTRCIRDFSELLLTLTGTVRPEWNTTDVRYRMMAIGLIGAVSESTKQWLFEDYRAPRALMVETTAPLFLGLLEYLTRTR
jgi:AcrR family transcriptional regulator